MANTIVIVGTLDTKGEEVKYLRDRIGERGHRVIVIDIGILDRPFFKPDIDREEVARSAGGSIDKVKGLGDEGKAIGIMAEGALKISKRLISEENLDGILAIGGSTGGSAGLSVLKGLPLGIPKLFLSAVGLSFIRPELAASDITIMLSIGDLWGINRITRGVLDKAAGAISGMVESYCNETAVPEKPAIGITTLGTAGLRYVPFLKPILKEKSHEEVIFTAILDDTESLKNLIIEEGQLGGVLDLCLVELGNCICNSNSWGPGVDRIKIAREKRIPLVVSPGALDFFMWCGTPDDIPDKYRGRQVHIHNPLVTLIKTSTEEKKLIAKDLTEELNREGGQVALLIPTRGFSEFDRESGIFYDPDGRKDFIDTLKRHLRAEIPLHLLNAHINDKEFALKAAELMDKMIAETGDE